MLGAIFAGLGVMAGAFGAHGLKGRLSLEYLQVFETAVRYQMYHAFGLIVIGFLSLRVEAPALKLAGLAFIAGIILFSGSLYGLTLSGVKSLGMITPFGGLAFILGWGAIIYGLARI